MKHKLIYMNCNFQGLILCNLLDDDASIMNQNKFQNGLSNGYANGTSSSNEENDK